MPNSLKELLDSLLVCTEMGADSLDALRTSFAEDIGGVDDGGGGADHVVIDDYILSFSTSNKLV